MSALLLLPGTIVAQSPSPMPAGSSNDANTLEERCLATAGTSGARNLCLFVVRSYLDTDDMLEPQFFEPGDTQQRDNAEVTVLDMDWDFKAPKAGRIDFGTCRWLSRCHPRQNKSVAALVRCRCVEHREKPSVHDWQAVDRHGFTYHNALWQKKPQLGSCKPGGSTKGWVTFYVREETDFLTLVERPKSDEPLSWLVQR